MFARRHDIANSSSVRPSEEDGDSQVPFRLLRRQSRNPVATNSRMRHKQMIDVQTARGGHCHAHHEVFVSQPESRVAL
jgi:hypothetical protein